ncbi:hypothetical protein RRG08_029141 [Elysia crispata]|uniref:Uncharacterized protein n=1 Tax=Elysia crispata TaxID=231223 RepID=A0AAE1CT80_9GAST|nr:hypothetical protein RRG08_029141 [Elysia crispata]
MNPTHILSEKKSETAKVKPRFRFCVTTNRSGKAIDPWSTSCTSKENPLWSDDLTSMTNNARVAEDEKFISDRKWGNCGVSLLILMT